MHNCFISPNVFFLKSIINSGLFWELFTRLETSGDGHCIVHSLLKSLKKQYNMNCNYHDILSRIRKETNDNISTYKQLVNIDSNLEMQRLVCAYIDGHNFDTIFGDLLPMILSNVLEMNIIIIHQVRNSTDPLIIVPRSLSNKFVYIFKSGDHYEGFETAGCFGSSIETLNTTDCIRSENLQQKITQVETSVASDSSENNSFTRTCANNKSKLCMKPRITAWNIYGMTEHKLDANEEFLRESTLIIVTETWSRGNIAKDIFPGYEYFDFFRPNQHPNAPRGAGGIGIFIKDEFINHIKIYKSYKDIIVWVKFSKSFFNLTNDLLIGAVYCYPEGSPCLIEDMYAVLFHEISSIPLHFDKLLCGDWNARIGLCPDWSSDIFYLGSDGHLADLPQLQTDDFDDGEVRLFLQYLSDKGVLHRTSQDSTSSKYGSSFLDLLKVFRMFVVNGRSGRDKDVGSLSFISESRGTSLIDYLVASPKTFMLIEDFGFESKRPESDHKPMTFSINCSFFEESNNLSHTSNWYSYKAYKWKTEELSRLNLALSTYKNENNYESFRNSMINLEDSNSIASNYQAYFSQACNDVFPLKTVTINRETKHQDWFDNELRRKRGEVIKLGERVLNLHDLDKVRDVNRQYKQLRQQKERTFKSQSIHTIELTMKNNKSNLWPIIKKLSARHSKLKIPTRDEFYNFFCQLSHPEKNDMFDYSFEAKALAYHESSENFIPFTVYSNETDFINRNITVEEVTAAIDYLKNNKSAGIDCIPSEFLKVAKNEISEDLACIFNYFLETRDFPSDWAVGLRSAIHKSGARSSTLNYRGITVLPMFEKLFEIIVQKRIEFIDEAFDNLDRYNNGFKKGSRTADNIFILLSLIHRQLSISQILILILVDFSKAFDRINRAILFYKIKKSGLRGRLIDTLISLYSKTCYRVKHQGKLSNLIQEDIGVIQGGNTSPMWFNKYLSDLKFYLDSSTGVCSLDEIIVHMLWADDLFMVSTNPKDAQTQLNELSSYSSPNQMIANDIKTKFMVFGRCEKFELKLNGKPIERVEISKCLGIMVNSISCINGDIFSKNPDYLKGKARQSIFSFLNRVKRIGSPSPKCLFDLYECLSQPILLYGSDLWGYSKNNTSSIDLLTNWYIRLVLGVKQGTGIPMLQGESGVVPPSVICHQRVMLYYIRLNNLPKGSVLKSAFLDMKRLSELSSTNNWCSHVLSIGNQYGLDLDLLDFNESTKTHVKSIVRSSFISKWLSNINDFSIYPGLRLYKLFKHQFGYEPYLNHIKNVQLRKSLTRFRCSSHSLEIERGRYVGRPEHERLCSVCNVIEDEFHVVMFCPLYDELRNSFFNRVIDMFPFLSLYSTYDQFLFFMGFNDKNLHWLFSRYIHEALEIRSGLEVARQTAENERLCVGPSSG